MIPPTARLHVWLMLALTLSTGIVDAVGYLGLDRVFTGNMTGNVVMLGMALTGADDLPIVGPILALACFFLGAMISGRMHRGRKDGWSSPTSVVFGLVAVILFLTAVALFFFGKNAFVHMPEVITSILGLVMGMQAAAARHVKVADVTTVVVTSTITGLAADSRFAAAREQPWARRFLAILLILLGAVIGAGLLQFGMWLPVLISSLVTSVALLLGHRRSRSEQRGANQGVAS
ncbi:YoaK family protein [Leifsonia sp. YAF41]|uniref:YoaK family protein n=1 Tax=Leifsonia sp. YAF41 TaxID=3233086 RepID=UPI003F9A01C7